MYARMLVREQPVQFQVCSQTLVMWNGTKVTLVGSRALPFVNPKTNEKYKVQFLNVKEDLTPLLGGCVTAVHFILFNFASYSPSIAMELIVSKESTCKRHKQRFETNKYVS